MYVALRHKDYVWCFFWGGGVKTMYGVWGGGVKTMYGLLGEKAVFRI